MKKDNCNIRCKNEVVELINDPHSKTQDVITLIQKQIEKYHYLIGTTAYIKYLYDNVGWEELNIWGRGKPMINPDKAGYLYDELSILMEHYSELEETEQNHLPCATQPEKSDDTQSLTPEPQQMELKDLLPKKLKADEAVEVFQNAIDAQLITNSPEGLKWNDTKQLLAYFATKVSDKFNLTTNLDKDGNKTTDWKTFETLFEQKGLKGAKQNWMRLNTRFEPTRFEKVDALF